MKNPFKRIDNAIDINDSIRQIQYHCNRLYVLNKMSEKTRLDIKAMLPEEVEVPEL